MRGDKNTLGISLCNESDGIRSTIAVAVISYPLFFAVNMEENEEEFQAVPCTQIFRET